MFQLGALILIVWGYCFFYQDLPLNVNYGLMIGGLFTMGFGLLKEKK